MSNIPQIYMAGKDLLSAENLKIELAKSKAQNFMTEDFASMCLYLGYITLSYQFGKIMTIDTIEEYIGMFMVRLMNKFNLIMERTGIRAYLKLMIINIARDQHRQNMRRKELFNQYRDELQYNYKQLTDEAQL